MIDLQRFCANEFDLRPYLRSTLPHRGYLYATNGHVMVRVPAPEHAAAVTTKPDLDAIISKFTGKEGHAPLPEFASGEDCTHCNGAGYVYVQECPDCDGEGEFTHGTHEYECKECDGDGSLPGTKDDGQKAECAHCYGHGIEAYRVEIGRAGYDGRYLLWIKELPGILFASGMHAEDAAHFIFDGGDGVLMPRRA